MQRQRGSTVGWQPRQPFNGNPPFMADQVSFYFKMQKNLQNICRLFFFFDIEIIFVGSGGAQTVITHF